MGKEWYWGGGKSSKREGGAGAGEGNRSSGSTPSGCMCAMFQLFDFHQSQFVMHQQQHSFKPSSFLVEDPPIPKGAEAPRNSLELEEPSLSSTIKEDESLNFPMGIQIKTNGGRRSKANGSDCSLSEISSSPGTKAPNLVARLMGLDLLPEHGHSPSPCLGTPNLQGKSHSYQQCRPRQPLQTRTTSHRSCFDSDFPGSRSLPETPRISSGRRSDVEHRLSLQINKENMSVGEEMVLSRISSLRIKELKTEEESRSPGHYARQIVKQVKESVGRKVGLDITNAVRNREQETRNEVVSQLRSRKISKVSTKVDVSSPRKLSPSPCSSRLKFLEPKNKPIQNALSTKNHNTCHSPKLQLPISSDVNILPQNTRAPTNPSLLPVVREKKCHHEQNRPIKKCKKMAEERFGPPPRLQKPPQTSDIIRTKHESSVCPTAATRASILDKKCKKTPLSNEHLSITGPTLLPFKKDPTPPATKIPSKQVPTAAQESKCCTQLSSCSSHSCKNPDTTHVLYVRDNNNADRSNGATTITTGDGASAEHYEYISRILRGTGIDKDTPLSFTRWFSPCHPLDPSIFYYLELFTPTLTSGGSENGNYPSGQLRHGCNRKLLFHLVDEILVEILRPYIDMKPWAGAITQDFIKGSHLVDMLCKKISSFPCADCRVLEDIDSLIDKDLPQLKLQGEEAFREEGEGIASEVEKDILDMLIHETAVIFYSNETARRHF